MISSSLPLAVHGGDTVFRVHLETRAAELEIVGVDIGEVLVLGETIQLFDHGLLRESEDFDLGVGVVVNEE